MTTHNTEPKPRPATDAEIDRVTKQAHEHGLAATWDLDTILPMAARIEQEREMRRELVAALLPFISGGWGAEKAWMVEGAPTREQGIRAAAKLSGFNVKADAALARAAKMEADNAH